MADGGTLRKVLIANRGEIAIRIARAASGLGIETVAVFAAEDEASLHTRMADTAVRLDGSGVSAYLDAAAIVAVAKSQGCDAIHPGYGFLSEHAGFARLCAENVITFIGPSPEVLALFGDKVRARIFAESHGIPVVPGSHRALDSADAAKTIAADLGYPVMLKASAGGGGRGMRRVDSAGEIAAAFARCQSEALAAFGDASVFVEKLVERPRHIEVQVLADAHGNVVHLYERDCSVQQRNQKVVEIAPAPALHEALRDQILRDATQLARASGYVNAGTVEFLVVPETSEHYFIECNPRLQVEHTVTEQVTGIDIVDAQFRLAAGEPLAALGIARQDAVAKPRGFAVQARVVASGPGTLVGYREPSGPGVRVDGSGYLNYAPPAEFDPLLAKVIAASNSSGSLESALSRTLAALNEFHVAGLPTNLRQLRGIVSHPVVRAGNARTTFLTEQGAELESATNGAGPLHFLEERAAELTAVAIVRLARVIAGIVQDSIGGIGQPIDPPSAGLNNRDLISSRRACRSSIDRSEHQMKIGWRLGLTSTGLAGVLAVGAIVLTGAAYEEEQEIHCVGHLENVPGEKASRLTERGCFKSFGEAVSVATNGRVQIADTKSRRLTDDEVRSGLDGETALLDTTTIIGIDYKNSGFGGSTYQWEVAWLPGCADGTGWGSSGMPSGWNDTVGSAIGYSGCNNYLHWEHTWFTGASLNCDCSSMGVMNDATSSEQWSQ